MATELEVIEPIQLPDPRRPGTMPSLPAWLERCSVAVTQELQPTETGSFADVETLPAHLMPSPQQRKTMLDHIDSLLAYLEQTPAESADAETKTASAVTGLLLVLPSARKSEIGAEVRADVYLDVLDDVPWWSVKAAVKRWHRHDCGNDENGRPYDYRWAPDPGTLRRVAYGETWPVKQRIRELHKVLTAREYIDCTHQLEQGRAALIGFNSALKSGDPIAATMTFAQAIERGTKQQMREAAE